MSVLHVMSTVLAGSCNAKVIENTVLVSISTLYALPGRIAQSVTCLATDASLTADQVVASSIPARSILLWRLIMK